MGFVRTFNNMDSSRAADVGKPVIIAKRFRRLMYKTIPATLSNCDFYDGTYNNNNNNNNNNNSNNNNNKKKK